MQRNDPRFLDEVCRSLYTAVLSDVLDELGLRDQAMPPSIRPLDESLTLAGFARTGLYREVFDAVAGENPYELEIALVDDLKPGEVAVFGCCGSRRIAPWGELLSTASRARGAAGCVTDGMVRDIRAIRALRFPASTAASHRSIRKAAARSPRSTRRSAAAASPSPPGISSWAMPTASSSCRRPSKTKRCAGRSPRSPARTGRATSSLRARSSPTSSPSTACSEEVAPPDLPPRQCQAENVTPLSRPEKFLWCFVAVLLVLAVALPGMPQDPDYHRFADSRTLMGVPNAMDVLSNIFFFVLGGIGLVYHFAGRLDYSNSAMRTSGLVFFLGFALTAVGSAYYHVDPNDRGLAWDRMGMVVAFAGVLGLVAAHRVSVRAANLLLPVALVGGVLSVAWFAATGSVTPYAVMQFGGIGMVAAATWMPAQGKGPNWAALIAAYALAKVLEMEDTEVLHLTQGLVSGHTLKHVFAALAALAVLLPLARAGHRCGQRAWRW